jgi:lysophospholipase L1-like esterase
MAPLLLAALLLAPAAAAAAQPAPAKRIMCLGDSITLGVGGGGYREPMAGLLQQHDGPGWDFVGPMYGNGGKHAGYNGWTIKQILTVAEQAMLVHQPSHLLVMAGTNDFFYQGDKNPKNQGLGANATVAVARMQALLKLVHDTLPGLEAVILSGVTHINATLCGQYSKAPWHPQNCPPSMPSDIASYNERMAAIAAKSDKVFFHDPNCNRTDALACSPTDASTWADGDYFTYGIHFSQSGYAKMAAHWQQALHPHLPKFPPPTR